MNNGIFGNQFEHLFNMMNDFGKGGTKQFFINGQEVTEEQFEAMRKAHISNIQSAFHDFNEPLMRVEMNENKKNLGNHVNKKNQSNGYLDKIGRNLTEEARQQLLDPVIGRDQEIRNTAEVLSRRIKNNPILVGEAGVGKTAIVEGLAQAIVSGNVPNAIKDKEIIAIDISSLEAGTQYRGAFEENIQKLMDDVKQQGNVILFIDEMHQMIGSGSTGSDSGSKGLSDILKPALSRGEISIIGATTQDEYRNNILKDAALSRRFNEVVVKEPSRDDAIAILEGIKSNYEAHHGVTIPSDVVKSCVDLSIQYMPQRLLPDKAIDLLDITAAHHASTDVSKDTVQNNESTILSLEEEKLKAIEKEDYIKAGALHKQIESLKKENKHSGNQLTCEDVAATVERITGIPVAQMDDNDLEHVKHIKERLENKIIGQQQAVEAVSKAIRRNRAGFNDGNRPIGSFLFAGPTGVGKTELAKQLAIDLFGNKDAMIRLDMSEYMDQTAVSKMIGTTAGYVGYDDNANTLTEQVRRNPYSVILFDEIEKANPQILTLLLQVLDDGKLTDGQGNEVNFKNTIIIATSNAGFGTGESNEKQDILEALKAYFRPEFLNRFNGIIEFKALEKDDLKQIVQLMLQDVQKVLNKKKIEMNVTDAASTWLIENGYDPSLGARPLRRLIEQEVSDRITDYYLDHLNISKVTVDVNEAADGLVASE